MDTNIIEVPEPDTQSKLEAYEKQYAELLEQNKRRKSPTSDRSNDSSVMILFEVLKAQQSMH